MTASAPPPPRVPRPVMHQDWRQVVFAHWRYAPDLVQPLLPAGLTAEQFDGTAWVGLVPLVMEQVRPPALPALPWLSRFAETNLRTYVRDAGGRTGIWFLSLDAARLAAVLAARATYRLPYFWSEMTASASGGRWSYRCRRRWPAPAGARCDADVDVGPPLASEHTDALAHFLTARYRLFTIVAGKVAAADAEHPEWPLHRARLRHLDQSLLPAAGLPAPDGAALLHASPGVRVRVGRWHW